MRPEEELEISVEQAIAGVQKAADIIRVLESRKVNIDLVLAGQPKEFLALATRVAHGELSASDAAKTQIQVIVNAMRLKSIADSN
jgi:hypothetical protein